MTIAFKTENELMNVALESPSMKDIIRDGSTKNYFQIEPRGLFGIPDLVAVNIEKHYSKYFLKRSFAFELKLSNWKRALVQAFRYRAFADFSYVVLDHKHVRPALNNIERFQKANIGLVSINTVGKIYIHFHPVHKTPYSESLRLKLLNIIHEELVLLENSAESGYPTITKTNILPV